MSNKKTLNQHNFSVKISIISAVFVFAFLLSANPAKAVDYYNQGILKSTNVLSGAAVIAINSFTVTATIPATATTSVQFSQDRANYYSSDGTAWGWDTCSDGSTEIDLSGLGWTGALFYKLKLETSDASTTPNVSQIQVDYTGDEVPAYSGTTYHLEGTMISTNVLSGAEVTAINSFSATSTLLGGTAASIQFSQDKANWYNASGTLWAWDSLSDGATNIDLSGLGWSGALYYKLKLTTADPEASPSITEIGVDYDGTAVPPYSGNSYPPEGFLVSEDLLARFNGSINFFNGTEKFGYNITSLPAGTAVYAQFSQDGVNWHSSTSTKWAWDTLSSGNHLEKGRALDLSMLGWTGDSFYYKLKLTTVESEQTTVVSEINLLRQATRVNAPLTNKMTGGLVGHWTFNGPDMDWASSIAEALDRSGQGNNGDVIGAKAVIGKVGQGMEFDGVDDCVDIPNTAFTGLTQGTINAWIKPTLSHTGALFHESDKDTTTDEALLQINYTGTVTWAVKVSDSFLVLANTISPVVNANEWTMVTLTVDSTGNTLYENTVPVTFSYTNGDSSSTEFLDDPNNVDFTSIGHRDLGGTTHDTYFNGLIDEVRVYNRALSAGEILDLYKAGTRTMKIIPTKSGKTIIKP